MGLLLSAGNEVVTLVFGVWMEDSFGLQIAALGIASAIFGFSELAGESLVSVVTDRLGKAQAVGAGLALNMLAAMSLPLSGGSQAGALAALSLFYITFEFTIVSGIPMMTEVLPQARATLMATFIASMALGRALGDLLGPGLYAHGMLANAGASVAFNVLALLALMGMARGVRDRG
jgi:predicted MFS family arabinose efflux permease